MGRLFITTPVRIDSMGDGKFGAPRGVRTHKGVDLLCPFSSLVHSPVSGVVTKLGYCYSDGIGGAQTDVPYRYVQVEDSTGLRHRLFYVEPLVVVGDHVLAEDTCLGRSQDLTRRHGRDMRNHIHYEILHRNSNEPVKPPSYF